MDTQEEDRGQKFERCDVIYKMGAITLTMFAATVFIREDATAVCFPREHIKLEGRIGINLIVFDEYKDPLSEDSVTHTEKIRNPRRERW